ncbi:MAG: hypothetical protein O2U61_01845 [Candidatus Bathyarchaeota archaeon]|nr:hypothetical protein [Candidatus Bathyarchaeota archaeon]
MNNLDELLRIYNRNYAGPEDWNLSDYRNHVKSIEQLVVDADLGIGPRVNRDKHQFRIPKKVLEEMAKNISDPTIIEEIKKCKCFDDIFTVIYELRIPNFGPLAVYDTALRIGAIFGYYPKVIYLHQGALEGAINLIGKEKIETYAAHFLENLDYPYISSDILPNPVSDMEPYHIENFLCINKDKF